MNNYIKLTNFNNEKINQLSSYYIMESDNLKKEVLEYLENTPRRFWDTAWINKIVLNMTATDCAEIQRKVDELENF